MRNYHFFYEDPEGRPIWDYSTDAEPPRVGDYVQLHHMSGEKEKQQYRVKEILYTPLSQDKVDIYIVVTEVER